MTYLAYLLLAQFIVAFLGYKTASFTIRKEKPSKGLVAVLLGFVAVLGTVSVLAIM